MRTCTTFLLAHVNIITQIFGQGLDDEWRRWLIDQAYTYSRCKSKGVTL